MVEIIPRSKARPPWWINTILIIALIFVAASIAGHIFLRMMVTDLDREIEDTKQRIVDLKTSANQEMEGQLLGYQTQIRNFNKILSEHFLISKALDLLENTIHPEVIYQNFSVNTAESRIQIGGLTRSYGSIGEQLLVLNNDARVQRVETSNYLRDKDGWISFRLIIDFNPAIIQ
jgi:hypothetical protein